MADCDDQEEQINHSDEKLIKKAIAIRKHLEKMRKDKDAKFRLILVESRIHRLARYYRNVKSLPATWRYNSKKADTLI